MAQGCEIDKQSAEELEMNNENNENNENNGTNCNEDRIIKIVVIVFAIVVTMFSAFMVGYEIRGKEYEKTQQDIKNHEKKIDNTLLELQGN